MYTRKTITAGSIVVQAVYPRRDRRDSDKVRAAKSKASTEAQRRLNLKHSWQKLELLLAANFPVAGSAMVCVLTYDDAHIPKTRKQALRRFTYFLKLLREAREAAGLPAPRVIYNTEVLTAASGRWHHHIVIDNTGRDLEILRRCWRYGEHIEACKLCVDEQRNHETLARYMSKEPRECQDDVAKPGLHAWSCTRNCLKPETDVDIVDTDTVLDPPAGVAVLYDERCASPFASWRVVKYRVDSKAFRPAPKARRRKRRRLL